MLTRRFSVRIVILIVILLAARFAASGRQLHEAELATPLSAFPLELAAWRGVEGRPFDEDTLRVLRVDDYVNRVYEHPAHGGLALYVAYYRSQKQGDTIHSPRNCLPGSGWQPISHSRPTFRVGDLSLTANRYIVERRGDRQLVLYWFQGRGRATANEYATKAYLLYDALRFGRSHGAVVRIVVPISREANAADEAVESFVPALTPSLMQWLP